MSHPRVTSVIPQVRVAVGRSRDLGFLGWRDTNRSFFNGNEGISQASLSIPKATRVGPCALWELLERWVWGWKLQKGSQGWEEHSLDVASKESLPIRPSLAQKCPRVGQSVLGGWERLE